jgi:hypothetical protein
MSESNFTALSGALTSPSVYYAVTHGIAPPNGATSGVRIFRSTVNTLGVAGEYYNESGFNPTSANTGLLIEFAFKKAVPASGDKFCPMAWVLGQSNAVTGQAYILGLTDSGTPKLALRKGQLSGGLPSTAAIGEQGILALSEATFALDEWIHVQFQAVVNAGGDTVIQVKTNNLADNPVDAPVWEYPSGMLDEELAFDATFVDDAAGVASGSPCFTAGRVGIGMWTNESSRVAAFDYIRIVAQ